jgi:hypothetical protein
MLPSPPTLDVTCWGHPTAEQMEASAKGRRESTAIWRLFGPVYYEDVYKLKEWLTASEGRQRAISTSASPFARLRQAQARRAQDRVEGTQRDILGLAQCPRRQVS